jgi:hypothetical protein
MEMTDPRNRKYVSSTEIAKHVRKVLKERWPETKFSVRTNNYAGGASIDVRWTDGPTEKMVDAVVKQYQSVSHMDITDLVHHKPVMIDGVEVSSGAHYIFAKRLMSAGHLRRAAAIVCADEGIDSDNLTIVESEYSGAYIEPEGIALQRISSNTTSIFGIEYRSDGLTQALAWAVKNYALNLTEQELLEAAYQIEALPLYVKVSKDGDEHEHQHMTRLRADRLNKELRDNGWSEQWVLETAPVGANQ